MHINTERYNKVAVLLHWTIALLIIGMIALGLTMGDYSIKYKFLAYNLHKSFGLTVLVLSLFRLFWRFTHKPPAFPDSMKAWEKTGAHLGHLVLYFLMIAMPLSGWIMVSADAKYPTVFFSLFEVPQFPLPAAYDTNVTHEQFEWLHYWLAISAIVLVIGHTLAALKHHFVNHDTVLRRMLPLWLQRRGKVVL